MTVEQLVASLQGALDAGLVEPSTQVQLQIQADFLLRYEPRVSVAENGVVILQKGDFRGYGANNSDVKVLY